VGNQLTQVFTHPYTPEENAHVESFHKILGASLAGDTFVSLPDIERRLARFYDSYNHHRPHGSTAGVPPGKFWAFYEDAKIGVEHLDKRQIKFTLLLQRQEVLSHPDVDRYGPRVK